jgi:Mn-dependent DtxR family transcriptional regulator
MSTKIIGTQEYINSSTGEIHQFDMVERKMDIMSKKGWRRTNLKALMNILSLVGNKKIEVFNLLIQNSNGRNQVELTQREVSKTLGISLETVSNSFTELSSLGLIKKIKNMYVINTQIVSAYGNSENNLRLCEEYGFYDEEEEKKEKEKEKTAAARIQKKLKTIAKIESDIKKINDEEKMKNRNRKKLTDEELNNFEFPGVLL